MEKGIIDDIRAFLTSEVLEDPYFLVDFIEAAGKKLIVYVDGPKGINISVCATINRQLNKYIEEHSLEYYFSSVEVSSPGMGSELKVPGQFQKYVGRQIELKKTDGRIFEGVLENYEEAESLSISSPKDVNEIPFQEIEWVKSKITF